MTKIFKDVNYGKEKHQTLNIYLADKGQATIIYIHGGGLTSGDKSDKENLFLNYNKNGIDVVSINYALYPDALFPTYINDSALAIRYIKDHYNEYNLNQKFYVEGESAGAYISMMLCFNEEYFKNVKLNEKDIVGYIFDSSQPTTHFSVLNERHLDPRLIRVDDAAPLYYLKEKDYQKMLIISYKDDITCRLAQNTVLYETLKYLNIKTPYKFIVLDGTHCSSSGRIENLKFPIEDVVYQFIFK